MYIRDLVETGKITFPAPIKVFKVFKGFSEADTTAAERGGGGLKWLRRAIGTLAGIACYWVGVWG